MALTSPGVQVSVVDESFYTPAAPGTRPLFIVASAANKQNGSGTGVAAGTLAANAGKVYTMTSQRELVETFGDPIFKVDSNNNPVHAAEQNEYGLQAAYSYLGVSNSALVVRADLNLGALDAAASAPAGEPKDGTFWLDVGTSRFGVFEWNGASAAVTGGQTFANKTPLLVLESSKLDSGVPKQSVGAVGQYALAPGVDAIGTDNDPDADDRDTHELALFYKNRENIWVLVGSEEWKASWPTLSSVAFTGSSTGGFDLNDTSISWTNSLAGTAAAINTAEIDGISAAVVNGRLEIYSSGVDVVIDNGTGTVLADLGIAAGSYYAPALTIQPHTQVPGYKSRDDEPRPTGSVWVKTTEPNAGARWRVKKYNSQTKLWEAVEAPLYASNQAALAALDATGGGVSLALNTAYVQFDFDTAAVAEFRVMRRARVGATVVKTKALTSVGGAYSLTLKESVLGSSTLVEKTMSFGNGITPDGLATAINGAGFTNITAESDAVSSRVTITHALGGEMEFSGTAAAAIGIYGLSNSTGENSNVYKASVSGTYVASNWIPLTITPDTAFVAQQSYFISVESPSTLVADGTLWYSSVVDEIDVMVHNGATWVGYKKYDHGGGLGATDDNGPIVSASEPTTQSDGVTPLVEGDLWIDTSDIENYPAVKRFNSLTKKWVEIDKTDQTTENGILFADARWSTAGSSATPAAISSLLESNYLDFDAPDPALYPRGMLLWNLRRSGFNVKKFVRNYVDLNADNIRYNSTQSEIGQNPTSGEAQGNPEGPYYPHRWVTESGNQADGSGSFGRKAQRKVIIQSLQALVNSNQDLRDTERNTFNLMACPGYPELIGEMVSLNYDRGLTAFVIGDTPARLRPDATTVNEWGTNLAGALQDDDTGLVSFDEFLGVFYPWGFTSDNLGNDVAVPPSHMICRMMALNDQVAYPWFAPAGTRRGGITNATAVGYINEEGEFQSVALNEGQRDTLYNVKVNPITYFVASGLVNFGQKTRAKNASALDRINVARLVIYLRQQLNALAKPYIFEPNDKITRDEIKQQVESLLVELVGLRALYDFLVVCDESNNTPNRIDRNELYVDIAVEPVKAIEFIYIPLRLKNTGEIAGL